MSQVGSKYKSIKLVAYIHFSRYCRYANDKTEPPAGARKLNSFFFIEFLQYWWKTDFYTALKKTKSGVQFRGLYENLQVSWQSKCKRNKILMQFIFVFILRFYSVWFLLSFPLFKFIPRLLYHNVILFIILSFILFQVAVHCTTQNKQLLLY